MNVYSKSATVSAMKKIILALLLCACNLSLAEELPSLSGLGTIGFAEEPVADPSFPEHLEKIGDIKSAILEWQRLIYDSSDKYLKTRARLSLARLQIKEGRHENARRTLDEIMAEDPETKRMPEVLYLLSTVADLTFNFSDGADYRKRIHTVYQDEPFLEQAERHTLWALGINGHNAFPEVFTPTAKALKTRLELSPTHNEKQASTATILSLLPGAGHLYLGEICLAFILIILNGSLIWALLTALKKRNWAYSSFFGVLCAILYIGTMFSAYSLTQQKAYESRLEKMKEWADLAPTFIAPLEPKKTFLENSKIYQLTVKTAKES